MKILKPILLLAVITALGTVQSCKKAIYNQLTEDEVKWLVYEKGDQFIFSRGADRDTFNVIARVRGYDRDKPYYNEVASVNFANPYDTLGGITNGSINISKDDHNQFRVNFVFPHFPQRADLTFMTPVAVDTINGIAYENVYIAVAETLTNTQDNFITKVYYTRDEGFLKLEDMYGNSWYKIN